MSIYKEQSYTCALGGTELSSTLSGTLGLALSTGRRSLGSNRSLSLGGLLNGSLGSGGNRSLGGLGGGSGGSRNLGGGCIRSDGSGLLSAGVRAGGSSLVVGAVTVACLAGEVGGVVSAGAGPDLGAGGGVLGHGRVVDAEEEAGVGGLESTGEGDNGRRLAGTGTVDGDLGTADVELGTVLLASAVETDVLGAHQVGTLGGVLGQGEGEVVETARLAIQVVGPLNALGTNLLPGHLVDLEPVAIAEVVGTLSAIGGLAHVDGERTGVAHLAVDCETDLIAGRDRECLGSGADVLVETAGVADDVLGGDVGDGAVGVGGLADILVRLGDLAVDNESLEVVVGKGGRESGSKGQGGGE
ncbi:hypothetical protein HG530_001225 [Fusarium avenaceum]|nr:hypothetical protein HG530_001225 [Fusarium avenaceum]